MTYSQLDGCSAAECRQCEGACIFRQESTDNYCYCGAPHPDDPGHDLRTCVHCEALCRPPEFHAQGECGGDCAGCCSEAEFAS